MKHPTPNPRKRPDQSGRLTSDAEIRRQKLRQIAATGSTEGINTKSLDRFWSKGYLRQEGQTVALTKKGAAVAAGRIGAAGRGAVDFDTANRAGRSSRDHSRRGEALSREGGSRKAEQQEAQRFAELEKEHAASTRKEAAALSKIIGTYAVTIAPSDGSTLTAEHLADLREAGWTVAPAPSAPPRLGSRVPGSRRDKYDMGEPWENPGDPLGELGEARAVTLRSQAPLDLDTVSTIRHHGFDLTPAPAKMRNFPAAPAPEKNPKKRGKVKNPSPGEMVLGPHASADTRKMLAKALAWFGDENLVTEPKILKNYKAPQAAVEVGDIVAIEYDSTKFDGKSRIYRHEATVKRKLYISPDGATLIVWPPFRITKRGIEG